MKQRVLQYGRLMPSLEKQLAEAFDVHRLVDEADPKAFLAQRGGEFVGLATQGFADAALIAALPKLKVISSFGVGVDKIDLKAAAERGIPVGNTPDVLNDCVADLAIGLMIDVARGIGASERYLRAGSWPKGAYPLQRRMSGKKLGILGLGRIGHAIAKRALAFDMDIRYHNRRPVVDTLDRTRAVAASSWRAGATFWWSSCRAARRTKHLVERSGARMRSDPRDS